MQADRNENAMLLEIEEAEPSTTSLPHMSGITCARTVGKKMLWRAFGCSVLLATIVAFGSLHGRFANGNDPTPPKFQTQRTLAGAGFLARYESAEAPLGTMHYIVDLASTDCGGPCQDGYTCVVAGTYSQCIDCSFTGDFRWECSTYDADFRKAAIETCNMPCDGPPPVLISQLEQPKLNATAHTDLEANEDYCALGPAVPDSHEDRCFQNDDGSLKVTCERPNSEDCGMQFSSYRKTGAGKYALAMQAPRGPGVATKFYLYTFGRNESRSKAWNSIGFEVFGMKCGKNETQILTTFDSGEFELMHPKYITVPFDACYDWHTYAIYVDDLRIMWQVDGEVYRKEVIKDDDMKATIDNMNFQAHVKLYGQSKESGKLQDMGFLDDSEEEFPIYGWFGNLDVPKSDGASAAAEFAEYV